ncbi:MAG: hypothetical protein A2X59_13520 [Nitrospirae bacterium GWC2_42_7]|nr:MAG: hypothetical protein A2X59_13520 [Nitrospirae bacterium GWC2_42_7]
MKKAIAIIVSLMFVFALTAVSFAEETAAPAAEQTTAKKAEKKQVTGEVTAVDAKANTLTVKKGKDEVTVTVDDKTKIMAGKDKKTLADVKVSDKVTVRYKIADGSNVAKSIELNGAPAKAAPVAAPAKKAAGY